MVGSKGSDFQSVVFTIDFIGRKGENYGENFHIIEFPYIMKHRH